MMRIRSLSRAGENRAATEPNPRLGLAEALRSGAERLGSGGELAKEVEAESRRRA